MDESQFQRELSKYKIVRLEDSYRPRFKKVEPKLLGTRSTHPVKSTTDKERVKTVDGKEASFWVLLEGALVDVLSPAETATFVGKMKKVNSKTDYCVQNKTFLLKDFFIWIL